LPFFNPNTYTKAHEGSILTYQLLKGVFVKKLNFAIRAALALSILLSGSEAFAQSAQFSVSSLPTLPSDTVIDAVASNGVLLGHYLTVTSSSTGTDFGGNPATFTAGTDTYFLTQANGANPTTISIAQYTASSSCCDGTFSLDSGNTPVAGAGYQGSSASPLPPTKLLVNSSGQILATEVDYIANTYLTQAHDASPLNVGSPRGPNLDSGLQLTATSAAPTVLGDSGAMAGPAVTSTVDPNTGRVSQTSTLAFFAPGANTSPAITTSTSGPFTMSSLPYRAVAGSDSTYAATAISNTTNRVAGTAVIGGSPIFGGGKEVGFVTGPNGTGLTLIGNSSGFSETLVNTVNDFGQIGGWLETQDSSGNATGESAFITNRTTGAIIGIGVGNLGDFTQTDFLNNAGQAIIEDDTNHQYYLYNGGTIYSVDALFGLDPSMDWTVVGLTSSGGIVLQDPGIYTVTEFPTDGTDNTTTDGFKLVAASEPSSGGSSVPAPGVFGLMGLSLAGLLGRKRRVEVAHA
jgi:LPXTG-motif cell wall-anchored protein